MKTADRDNALLDLQRRVSEIENADSWKNWRKQKSNQIAAWTVVLAAVCVVVTTLGWLQPRWSDQAKEDRKNEIANVLRDQLEPIRSGQQKTEDAVGVLSAQVGSLKDNVNLLLGNALKITASLSQKQFDENLKGVVAQLALGSDLRYSTPDKNLTNGIRSRLVHSDRKEDPEYWKASSGFLTYASFNTLHPQLKTLDFSNMRPCFGGGASDHIHFDAQFQCVFVLDGQTWSNVDLLNGVVIYHGGPTHLTNVRLTNCYFAVEVQDIPPQSGRQVIDTLLASGQSAVLNAG